MLNNKVRSIVSINSWYIYCLLQHSVTLENKLIYYCSKCK